MGMELSGVRGRGLTGRERGLSLIEAVIAAGLLLVIAVGIIPLFTQAMSSNQSGADSTSVSNMARSQVEELYQLPFNNVRLTLTGGTELVISSYYSLATRKWYDGEAPVGDPALWTRTATIRQYSVNSLDDGLLEPTEALEADALPGQVHFKEIEVAALGTRQAGPLGPSRHITLRMLKSQ